MIPGIDVSNWQNEINWQAVAQSGCRFAFIKATEGATFQDKRFAENRATANKLDIAVGAYHYLRNTSTVPEQLENFSRVVGNLRPGELPPALDVEDPKQWAGYSSAEVTELVLSWLRGAHRTFGVHPFVYMSPSFADAFLDSESSDLGNYPLWIAHWNTEHPRVPKPWQRWTVWQHSSTGRVLGIQDKVDLDWFSGEDEELQLMRV